MDKDSHGAIFCPAQLRQALYENSHLFQHRSVPTSVLHVSCVVSLHNLAIRYTRLSIFIGQDTEAQREGNSSLGSVTTLSIKSLLQRLKHVHMKSISHTFVGKIVLLKHFSFQIIKASQPLFLLKCISCQLLDYILFEGKFYVYCNFLSPSHFICKLSSGKATDLCPAMDSV